MPQLTLPVTPAGLAVEVLLGLSGESVAALQASGKPAPLLTARGLLDTGTTVTAVVPAFLQQLGVPSLGDASTHTPTGQVKVRSYRISLTIPSQGGQTGPFFLDPALRVTELPGPLPDTDVIIGRDVLQQCLLVLNGPHRLFTLAT
jgi:hypothetical protein